MSQQNVCEPDASVFSPSALSWCNGEFVPREEFVKLLALACSWVGE